MKAKEVMQTQLETSHCLNFQKSFEMVGALVENFKSNEKHYLSPAYQEAEARKEFIDKFWIALGWDVNHETQKNPYEQEVKIERKEQGSSRRADYAFYLAPNFRDVKFYVEAKKPFGDIATLDNYFQTIRYGWSSDTKIAVLFDFEQFEIVDCRFKPNLETALQRNLKKFHYSQYADEKVFAEIYWLFSREAVTNSSLEKYAESLPKKRGAVQRGLFKGGYQSIDEAFLEELDAHRNTLARIFKNSNPELDGETLTEITQRTLDRLVFMRFLEDKLIEPQYLVAKFGERGSAWGDFIATSRRLDGIYNGIVFKKNDILDSPAFKVNDDQFGEICEALCHINSPYDFNAIPIHILGSIYERFLGKVIVIKGKKADVEPKPEVRKAGGVYYTPEYIVRYIVENTVGKLIKGKTPAQIAGMRFADIACGSGSFLLGVYDLLIRYHTKFYNENPGKAKKGDVMQRDDGLHLSLQKKREILVNNIYGVDIDNQAVEVAQLSLYLKLLQDETPASARDYQMEFTETLLPSLAKNIVCGNSLIGTDILIGELFEPVEERKLNPMNFEDRFPEIMKRGGFDAIVGNPPWVDIKGLPPNQVDYYFDHYDTVANRMNLYAVFMQRAWSLVRDSGLFGYITPNSFLTQSSYTLLRRMFLKNRIHTLIRTPDDVFEGVTAETAISIFEKRKPLKDLTSCVVYPRRALLNRINFSEAATAIEYEQNSWANTKDCIFVLRPTSDKQPLLDKIQAQGKQLIQFCDFCLGLTPYDKYKGHTPKQITERVFHSAISKGESWKKLLDGGDVERYQVEWSGDKYINYGPWLGAPREQRFFTNPRIIIRQIISGTPPRIYAGYSDKELYHTQIAFVILPREKNTHLVFYFLALLNSHLLTWYHRHRYLDPEKYTFQKILIQDAKQFPIPAVDMKNSADKAQHDKMVSLVEQMLAAKKQLAGAQSDKDKDFYENKCAALDRQIDALVYELYSLTEDEIKIVEGVA